MVASDAPPSSVLDSICILIRSAHCAGRIERGEQINADLILRFLASARLFHSLADSRDGLLLVSVASGQRRTAERVQQRAGRAVRVAGLSAESVSSSNTLRSAARRARRLWLWLRIDRRTCTRLWIERTDAFVPFDAADGIVRVQPALGRTVWRSSSARSVLVAAASASTIRSPARLLRRPAAATAATTAFFVEAVFRRMGHSCASEELQTIDAHSSVALSRTRQQEEARSSLRRLMRSLNRRA